MRWPSWLTLATILSFCGSWLPPIAFVAHTSVPSTNRITLLGLSPRVSLNFFLHNLPSAHFALSRWFTHSFTRFPLPSKLGRWSLHGLGKLKVPCKHSKVTVQLFEGSVICPETKPPGLPCSQRLRVSKGRAEDVTVRSIWESLVSLGCRNSVVTSAKEIFGSLSVSHSSRFTCGSSAGRVLCLQKTVATTPSSIGSSSILLLLLLLLSCCKM